jgi:hypothetical protein
MSARALSWQPTSILHMAIMRRALLIVTAYLAASLAASAVLTIVVIRPGLDDFLGTNPNRGAIWGVIVITTIFVAILALAPGSIAVIVAEVFRIRSIGFYAVAGFGAALLCYLAGGFPKHAEAVAYEATGFAIAGLAAGVVYWAIAGRKRASK